MTALVHPCPAGRARGCRPPALPVAARPTPGARPTAAQFRRRRAAVTLAAAVLLGAGGALGVPGGVPLTPSGPAPAAQGVAEAELVAQQSYVARPGDTLWQIARALQPTGDVRPLVQRLAAGRGTAPLRAGERLVLPPA